MERWVRQVRSLPLGNFLSGSGGKRNKEEENKQTGKYRVRKKIKQEYVLQSTGERGI